MPIDNVQRFERLCNDAIYLQSMADDNADLDDINMYTETLELNELINFHVEITGGLVEVSALDDELDEISIFVPNSNGVEGSYQGVAWKYEVVKYPDGSTEAYWRICHSIGGISSTYIDKDGDRIIRTPLTKVTAEGSKVNIASPVGSHDYRKIALDAVCHRFDELAFDDEMDKSTKAHIVAKITQSTNISRATAEDIEIGRQRISYINHLGIFDSTLVVSPIAIGRSQNETVLLKGINDSPIMADVKLVTLDTEVTPDGNIVDNTRVLSYEVELPGYGHVSIPHIVGVTKVFDLWQR